MPTCISQRNLTDLIGAGHGNVVLLVVGLPANVPVRHKQAIFVSINLKCCEMEGIKMKRKHAIQTFLLCSRYPAEPRKACGQSDGREVADREWGRCLAGESAAVHNKTVAITAPRWYLVSLDMEPAIKTGDGGHNPPCFALRTAVKSVLVMRSLALLVLFVGQNPNTRKQKHACAISTRK